MLSRNLIQATNQYLSALNEAVQVRRLSTASAKHLAAIAPHWMAAVSASNDQNASPALRDARRATNAAQKELRQISAGRVFIELDRLKRDFRFPPPDHPELGGAPIANAAEKLYAAYESFVGSYSQEDTLALVTAGAEYERLVQWFEVTAEGLTAALGLDRPDDEASEHIEIVLLTPKDLDGVAKKLRALAGLYEETAKLVDVDVEERPLRLIRIETGSLWTLLVGDTRVIEFVIGLLERSINYLHRRFTDDGQIAAIPRSVEAVEAVLGLSERLREAGVDTTEMDIDLARSGVALSRHLNTLLGGEPSVEINGRPFTLAPTLRAQYIAGQRRALQPGQTQAPEDDPT